MKCDYIIRNGRVFDPHTERFELRDVYIGDGKFVQDAQSSSEAQIIDATGKLVLPGLIDCHTHLNYLGSNIGCNADLLCIPSGVTSAVDGGTAGYANFPQFYSTNIVRYVPCVMEYLHVSSYGVKDHCTHPEEHDPADFDFDQIVRTFEKYPDVLRGLKIRVFGKTMDAYGTAPLEKTVEMADRLEKAGFKCLVNMHYTGAPQGHTLSELLDILRPGDLFSHVYQTMGETIFGGDGRIKPEVNHARARGVLFDTANGRPLWSFDHLERAFSEGFYPDTVSSDVIHLSMYVKPAFSLPHAMSVMYTAGMPLEKLLRAVTLTPAEMLGITDRAGTLDIGKCADLAIFDLMDTGMVLSDKHGGSRRSKGLFVPLATIRAGKLMFRQLFF